MSLMSRTSSTKGASGERSISITRDPRDWLGADVDVEAEAEAEAEAKVVSALCERVNGRFGAAGRLVAARGADCDEDELSPVGGFLNFLFGGMLRLP